MQQCNLGNICALCIMQALSWAASGDPRLLVNLEQLFADAAGLGLKVVAGAAISCMQLQPKRKAVPANEHNGPVGPSTQSHAEPTPTPVLCSAPLRPPRLAACGPQPTGPRCGRHSWTSSTSSWSPQT